MARAICRILIVDDEPAVRRLLQSILEDPRREIQEAGGVGQARKVLGTGEVDVVVTDQQMPDGTGLDVLTAAREYDPARLRQFRWRQPLEKLRQQHQVERRLGAVMHQLRHRQADGGQRTDRAIPTAPGGSGCRSTIGR